MIPSRIPRYGDVLAVDDASKMEPTRYCLGVVNSGADGTHTVNGSKNTHLFLVCQYHTKSQFVNMRIDAHGKGWKWPEEARADLNAPHDEVEKAIQHNARHS